MGLFSKPKELCCVCGVETGTKRIKDGMVCKSCCSNCMPFMKPSSSNTKYEVQKAIDYRQTNAQRMELYNATKKSVNILKLIKRILFGKYRNLSRV